mmetsp:Transcript_10097/g.26213  ORF Transcript_10097/g.26213 Transcript_10097/m.26213 type:complete len:114 (+) Transcript_10097:557-898(+)
MSWASLMVGWQLSNNGSRERGRAEAHRACKEGSKRMAEKERQAQYQQQQQQDAAVLMVGSKMTSLKSRVSKGRSTVAQAVHLVWQVADVLQRATEAWHRGERQGRIEHRKQKK